MSQTELWEIIALSLRIALVATVATLPFALATAYILARREFRGKHLFNTLVHLPLVLPPVAIGYLLLIAFAPNSPLGTWLRDVAGIELAFRWTGAALAAAIMAFPLMVRSIRIAIEGVDRGLEDAARTLGAHPAIVFATITLPLILPGVIAASVLGFAKAIGEFGATITFVSNIPGETRTLPSAIYTFLQVPGGDSDALTLVAISVAIALVAVLASEWLARRATHQGKGNR